MERRLWWRRSGREELPHVQSQGQQPGRATPCPSSVVVAGRSYPPPEARGSGLEEQPNVQGVVAVRAQEVLEESSHFEGQERQQEEILLIQDKEQRLCFSGAALKRYSMPKVRETQARW